MSEPILVQAAELNALLASEKNGDILVCDCSFDLADPAAGRRAHEAEHIPGAVYVGLEEDLSAPRTGKNGRHPLPDAQWFAARMAQLGASDDTLIVAYDNASGMYAARLWWMLGWAGHSRRRVLDGNLNAWKAAHLPLASGPSPKKSAGSFSLRPALHTMVDYATVQANLTRGERQLIDARNNERFRGQNETLDKKAGHIPGARNRFFMQNLQADGRYKQPGILHEEYSALLGDVKPENVVNQCGSGVTACHNLLAMELAGLSGSALYPGSWSEWSQQDNAPVATGDANFTAPENRR
ncbi:sulfurtransferase [Pusillimonas sp. TS35]|uniref:sulfurtransferase n=1 Tax=Paracandidimonas lactea TaxID=2895524 RepID=UPI00136C22CF|nr:sulfurtransferase [Paracandidimonas lactea]MYN13306.1 sulfurtransferase [Pusillimonas sp. TS35]